MQAVAVKNDALMGSTAVTVVSKKAGSRGKQVVHEQLQNIYIGNESSRKTLRVECPELEVFFGEDFLKQPLNERIIKLYSDKFVNALRAVQRHTEAGHESSGSSESASGSCEARVGFAAPFFICHDPDLPSQIPQFYSSEVLARIPEVTNIWSPSGGDKPELNWNEGLLRSLISNGPKGNEDYANVNRVLESFVRMNVSFVRMNVSVRDDDPLILEIFSTDHDQQPFGIGLECGGVRKFPGNSEFLIIYSDTTQFRPGSGENLSQPDDYSDVAGKLEDGCLKLSDYHELIKIKKNVLKKLFTDLREDWTKSWKKAT